jgi:hypothetical protein
MGVNIFAPVNSEHDADAMVEFANAKAKGRFDWCDKFEGPGGCCLSIIDALAFSEKEAPWWVLTKGKMVKTKTRRQWQRLLIDSGCHHVIFLKARL